MSKLIFLLGYVAQAQRVLTGAADDQFDHETKREKHKSLWLRRVQIGFGTTRFYCKNHIL